VGGGTISKKNLWYSHKFWKSIGIVKKTGKKLAGSKIKDWEGKESTSF